MVLAGRSNRRRVGGFGGASDQGWQRVADLGWGVVVLADLGVACGVGVVCGLCLGGVGVVAPAAGRKLCVGLECARYRQLVFFAMVVGCLSTGRSDVVGMGVVGCVEQDFGGVDAVVFSVGCGTVGGGASQKRERAEQATEGGSKHVALGGGRGCFIDDRGVGLSGCGGAQLFVGGGLVGASWGGGVFASALSSADLFVGSACCDPDDALVVWVGVGTRALFGGLVGIGGAALWLREGAGRWFSVGVAWWFCAMLPIAGVIPIAFPIADRYTLLPMVGIALIGGAWWGSLVRARPALAKPQRSWWLWFAFSCVIGMGMYTRHAVAIWQTDEQLWSYNARLVPNEWAVFLNLGGTSGGKGEFPKARAALERAWLLAPHRYLVLQSLFLARAVVLEPKVGVSLHRAFLFARNDREKLKQMLMSPYIYRHAPLISLIRFRIKSLDQPPKPTEACRDERELRWRLHPDHPQRSARSAW